MTYPVSEDLENEALKMHMNLDENGDFSSSNWIMWTPPVHFQNTPKQARKDTHVGQLCYHYVEALPEEILLGLVSLLTIAVYK